MNAPYSTEQKLGNFLIAGLGKTGLGLAEWALKRLGTRIDSVTIYGGGPSAESDETVALRARGAHVVLGTDDVEGSYDMAVCAPGIPDTSSFAHSIRSHAALTISEPEFAWRESPERWLAITGSNGKTTATYLLRDLLCAAGMHASEVGNVGRLAISATETRATDEWFVAELSSFQLAATQDFHPRAASLLNISPDHISWHGSFEAYVAAKERIFSKLNATDFAGISLDDAQSAAIAERLVARGLEPCVVSVEHEPQAEHAAFVRNGVLTLRHAGDEVSLIAEDELRISGPHNMQNALFVSAMARFVGADPEAVRRGLMAFNPLEHRIEPCGTWRGISFVNDSKATNVDAACAAIRAYPAGNAVLLLGGEDKDTDLSDLLEALKKHAKAIVCFGEAKERFVRELSGALREADVPLLEANHLSDAFERALDVCVSGDVLLLSPACASHDEFSSFEERGQVFKQLVSALGR